MITAEELALGFNSQLYEPLYRMEGSCSAASAEFFVRLSERIGFGIEDLLDEGDL